MRLRRLNATTQTQMAHYIAGRLLSYADGPTDAPATWQGVCYHRGITVRLYHSPGAHAGEWCADIADGEPAVIAVNTAYSPREQARAFVHELAELLMYRMQPPLLSDMSDAGRYDGEPHNILHKMARNVEALVVR